MNRFSTFVVTLLIFGLPAVLHGQTATQTFDSEASAAADGWTGLRNRVNNFDFGFSPTNNAQGAGSGEGGGQVARSQPTAYYADTTLFGRSDLSIDVQASGRLRFQDSAYDGEFFFGWFDSIAAEASGEDYLGIHVREPRNGLWRVNASIDGADGPQLDVPDDVAFDFTMDWDADGGAAAGDGRLTLNLTSVDGLDVFDSEVEGSDGMEFDAFGLFNLDQSGDPNQVGNFWFDDLQYSLVGEPFVPGDVNRDGNVDLDDFETIRLNFLQTVASSEEGDLNLDGVVDNLDFREWKANRIAAVGGSGAVPEPNALMLAAIAGLAVLSAQSAQWRTRLL